MEALRWFKNVISELQTFSSIPVSHYEAEKKTDRYIIWAEDEQDNFQSNNLTSESVWVATIDLYTRTEFDPAVDLIQNHLNINKIVWSYLSTQYESDTGYIHHEWEVSIDGQNDSPKP